MPSSKRSNWSWRSSAARRSSNTSSSAWMDSMIPSIGSKPPWPTRRICTFSASTSISCASAPSSPSSARSATLSPNFSNRGSRRHRRVFPPYLNPAALRSWQLVILELVAQLGLEQLARGGVRQLVHEHDVVRDPPFCNLALEETDQFLAGHLRVLLLNHDQQRPFVPLWMAYPDHRRFRDRGVRDRGVLQIDRA